MPRTKSDQQLIDKLERDIAYWKKQAGIVQNAQSRVKWTDYTEEETIYLPEVGTIEFRLANGKEVRLKLKDDAKRLHINTESLVSIHPSASNDFSITVE